MNTIPVIARKLAGANFPERLNNDLVGNVGSQGDVAFNRPFENGGVLEDNADIVSDVLFRIFRVILAVDVNVAFFKIVKTLEQFIKRAFPTRGADEANELSCLDIKRDIFRTYCSS